MSNSADDIAARLGQVQDDVDATSECRRWLTESMREGATCEELLAQLIGNGWHRDQAEALVEEVRKQTRESRGVLTQRDRIAHPEPTPTKVIRAGNIATAIAGNLVFAAGRAIERKIGAETNVIRDRIRRGLCHKCEKDVRGHADQCPHCGAPIIGPGVL